MAPVSQAPRRYLIEFFVALVLYNGAVGARGPLAAGIAEPVLHTAIILSPVLPVCLMALATVRLYRRLDEYQRLQLLESLAIASGVTCVIAASWQFLEDVGFPHLPILSAWLIFAFVWGVAGLRLCWKDKIPKAEA